MNRSYLATAGIPSTETRALGSLLDFLRRSLRSEWVVVEPNDRYDAVLVDLDTETGRRFWETASGTGAIRIAVSAGVVSDARYLVRRPWHRDGEYSLVRVLNSVGVGGHESVIPNTPPPLPASSTASNKTAAGGSLLGAIENLRSTRQRGRLCLGGVPSIYVDGTNETFVAEASLPNLLRHLRDCGPVPCEIRPIQNGAGPQRGWLALSQLEWLARLTSPAAPDFAGDLVQLTRWPQFIQYPCEVVHLRMASILLKQKLAVPALAALAGSTAPEAAGFVYACDLLGLAKHQAEEVAAAAVPPPAAPQPSVKAGLFRRILTAIRSRQA